MQDNEREIAIAKGIGLVAAGHAVRHAADASGIAPTTLYDRYVKTLGPNAPNKEEERRKSEERIIALASAVAEASLERMATEIHGVDQRTLTAWHSAAANSLGRLRGWDRKGTRDDDERGVGRLTQLLEGLSDNNLEATLSIKRAEPVPTSHVSDDAE